MVPVEHYFTKKPTSKERYEEFSWRLRGVEFKFKCGSGVFSIGHVDKGSYLLIEKCEMEDGWRVLDLGCGYGCVGIAVKGLFPNTVVVCSDINERAVMLTRENAKKNNVSIKALESDIYENIKGEFNTILLNPPQTAGREICKKMISGALEHLEVGGSLQLVARHQKGGKTLAEYMKEVFGNVKDIAKQGGFRVYVSYNNNQE